MSRQVISDGPSGAVPISKHWRFQDLTGVRSGKLLVTSHNGKRNGVHYWNVRCDCGRDHVVKGFFLSSGIQKGCGCIRLKHGHGSSAKGPSPTYRTWMSMRARCHRPNHHNYPNYGARGIYVCDRWRDSFKNFLEDMGERPSLKHTIERVDNDGPYSPKNCIWILSSLQPRNTRHCRMVSYQGETHCLAEWSEITGILYTTIQGRLNRGWSPERTLTEPVAMRHPTKGK